MISKFRVISTANFTHHKIRTVNTGSKWFNTSNAISLRMILPPSKDPEIVHCEDTDSLVNFVKTYKGTLCAIRPDGSSEIVPPAKYCEISPSTLYKVVSPFFGAMSDERLHRQIADKAFEQKSREAMIHYLDEHQLPFHELDRIIKVDGKPIAEWEGVFQLASGNIWFLECKHCVSIVFFHFSHLTTT